MLPFSFFFGASFFCVPLFFCVLQKKRMLLFFVVASFSLIQGYQVVDGTNFVVFEPSTLLPTLNAIQAERKYVVAKIFVNLPRNQSDADFLCVDGKRISMMQPWAPFLEVHIRRTFSKIASILEGHPGRSFVKTILVTWTGELTEDEWRFSTDVEPCWFSGSAKASFTAFLCNSSAVCPASNIAASDIPEAFQGANETLIQTYWHIVDKWYQTSLVDFGRTLITIASTELLPLGVRLVVKLPAFPFLSAHWAYLAGYNSSLTFFQIFEVLKRFGGRINVWIPGIDFAAGIDEFEKVIDFAKGVGIENVWTSFRTHLTQTPDHWNEIHNLLQIHSIDAFVAMNQFELDGSLQFLTNTLLKNPFEARKFFSLRLAASVPSDVQATPEFSSLSDIPIPFQLLVPPSSSIPAEWFQRHNGIFHFSSSVHLPFYFKNDPTMDVGIPSLDPSKNWWIWTGKIDCDSVAPTGHFLIMVNVTDHPTLDDVFELSCGLSHILDLSLHTLTVL
jgi:hypothetical protein